MKRIITSFCAVIMAVIMLGCISRESYAAGTAPVAKNLELKTYRNVSVGGMLSAFDADDDVTEYKITTFPVKGELTLNEDGSFIYTPAENKKGRDYFGYKVVDSEGNYSQEATVIIKIEKQNTAISYSDMKGRAEEYAAIVLAERDIFVGEKIGKDYCFFPDKEMSKAEFLAMSILVSGEPYISAVMNYNSELPSWLACFACSATVAGYESYDNWFETIDYNEAASMLNNIMNLTEISYMDIDAENELAQACANLSACGIVDSSSMNCNNLSRAEAAQMLCKALALTENR